MQKAITGILFTAMLSLAFGSNVILSVNALSTSNTYRNITLTVSIPGSTIPTATSTIYYFDNGGAGGGSGSFGEQASPHGYLAFNSTHTSNIWYLYSTIPNNVSYYVISPTLFETNITVSPFNGTISPDGTANITINIISRNPYAQNSSITACLYSNSSLRICTLKRLVIAGTLYTYSSTSTTSTSTAYTTSQIQAAGGGSPPPQQRAPGSSTIPTTISAIPKKADTSINIAAIAGIIIILAAVGIAAVKLKPKKRHRGRPRGS